MQPMIRYNHATDIGTDVKVCMSNKNKMVHPHGQTIFTFKLFNKHGPNVEPHSCAKVIQIPDMPKFRIKYNKLRFTTL